MTTVAKRPKKKRHPLGERIVQLLGERGLNQKELAVMVDMRVATISDLVNDPNPNPTLETLNKLAAALDCTVADLFAHDPQK